MSLKSCCQGRQCRNLWFGRIGMLLEPFSKDDAANDPQREHTFRNGKSPQGKVTQCSLLRYLAELFVCLFPHIRILWLIRLDGKRVAHHTTRLLHAL